MLPGLIPEVLIVREKHGARQLEQDGDQVGVIRAFGRKVDADHAAPDAPADQLFFLQTADVFVENDHAAASSRAARAMCRTCALWVKSEPAR